MCAEMRAPNRRKPVKAFRDRWPCCRCLPYFCARIMPDMVIKREMKYCRFQLDGQAQYGLVESVAGRDAIVRILLTPPEEDDGVMESLRTRRIEAIPLEQAVLLPPVRPSKIVCIGRNYREHAS